MRRFDPDVIRARLLPSGAEFTDGLRDGEFCEVEERFGSRFGADHRELLSVTLPVGPRWPDWRHGPDEQLHRMLAWPVEGILFDVGNNAFWPPSWGRRPADPAEALSVAATRLSQVPRLVPIVGHRYLPAGVAETGFPVFSVYQSDVIYYGSDLVSFIIKTGPT